MGYHLLVRSEASNGQPSSSSHTACEWHSNRPRQWTGIWPKSTATNQAPHPEDLLQHEIGMQAGRCGHLNSCWRHPSLLSPGKESGISHPSLNPALFRIMLLIEKEDAPRQHPTLIRRLMMDSQYSIYQKGTTGYFPENGTTGQPQLFGLPLNKIAGAEDAQHAGFMIPKLTGATNEPFPGVSPELPFSVVDIDGRATLMIGKNGCDWGAEAWELIDHDDGTQGWLKLSASLNIRLSTGASLFYAQKTRKVYSFNPPCTANGEMPANSASTGMSVFSISVDEVLGKVIASSHPSSKSLEEVHRRSVPRENWIPYSGFSINRLSEGNSAQQSNGMEQEKWLLIGGHREQTQLITDIRQLSIFSTPDLGWVYQTAETQNLTSLAPSRSGHATIQSKDGKQIIIFGGWVGNNARSAIMVPEQGVLVLDFSGKEWIWSSKAVGFPPMPAVGGDNLTPKGIFGHSAIMLDHEIVLISGGYQFSQDISNSPISGRAKSTIESNHQVYMFNTTSFSYITEYNLFTPHVPSDHPTTTKKLTPTPTPKNNPDPNINGRKDNPWGHSHIRKVVISIGSVIGFVALLGLVAFILWFSRRIGEEKRQILENSRRLEGFGMAGKHKKTPRKKFIGKPTQQGLLSGQSSDAVASAGAPLFRENISPFSFEEGVVDAITIGGSPVYHPPRQLRRIFHHRGIEHSTIRSISPIIEGDEEPDHYIRRNGVNIHNSPEDETRLVIKGKGSKESFTGSAPPTAESGNGHSFGLYPIPTISLDAMARGLTRHFSNRSGRYFSQFQKDEYGRLEEDEAVMDGQGSQGSQCNNNDPGSDWGRLVQKYRNHVEFVRALSGNSDFWDGESNDVESDSMGRGNSPKSTPSPPLRTSSSLSARIKGLIQPAYPQPLHSTTTVSAAVALTPSPCSSTVALTASPCSSSHASSSPSPNPEVGLGFGRWAAPRALQNPSQCNHPDRVPAPKLLPRLHPHRME
ncbi:hypothetical protein DFH27DRAFT_633228 [Peziza echinospora]|nr:hypothetical protein DFH27DRAFT_633228 [Peziza echinospora]